MIPIAQLQARYGTLVAAVVLACRVFAGTATAQDLQAFIDAGPVDWPAFLKLVSLHRIRPVVNSALSSLSVPAEVRTALQNDATQIALRNFTHYKEQQRITTALATAGITVVPYKGCACSIQFYGDLSLRESSDLDFLIPTDTRTADTLHTAMQRLGYDTPTPIPAKYLGFYHAHVREYKYVLMENGTRKFLAEFHTALNDRSFETATPVTNEYLFRDMAGQHGALMLSPTAHAIALITHHGIREQWSNLKNMMDLAMAVNNEAVDWKAIGALAAEARFHSVLQIGLSLVNDVIGRPSPLPRSAVDTGSWMNNLLAPAPRPVDRTWRYNFGLKMKAKDSFGDKLGMLRSHAAYAASPSLADYSFLPLPKPLFFLYVIVKPLRKLISPGRR
jgi:Uncharacterised nucleotidyltransferase